MLLIIFIEDFDVLDFVEDDELDLLVLDYVLDDEVVGLVYRKRAVLVGCGLLDLHKKECNR